MESIKNCDRTLRTPCSPTHHLDFFVTHCNHFHQLQFSDPITTVLNANTNSNRARAASSNGLPNIRLGVTLKKLLHISFNFTQGLTSFLNNVRQYRRSAAPEDAMPNVD